MKIVLKIDGQILANSAAWVHFQKESFPGGHNYEICVEDPSLVSVIRDVAQPTNELSVNDGELCLRAVSSRIDRVRGEVEGQYMLNTVDSLQINGDVVTVRGKCSEVV